MQQISLEPSFLTGVHEHISKILTVVVLAYLVPTFISGALIWNYARPSSSLLVFTVIAVSHWVYPQGKDEDDKFKHCFSLILGKFNSHLHEMTLPVVDDRYVAEVLCALYSEKATELFVWAMPYGNEEYTEWPGFNP